MSVCVLFYCIYQTGGGDEIKYEACWAFYRFFTELNKFNKTEAHVRFFFQVFFNQPFSHEWRFLSSAHVLGSIYYKQYGPNMCLDSSSDAVTDRILVGYFPC